MNKKKLKEKIASLIQGNIDRHYQYLGQGKLPINSFTKNFIPTLLKELNKDIENLIDRLYEEEDEQNLGET